MASRSLSKAEIISEFGDMYVPYCCLLDSTNNLKRSVTKNYCQYAAQSAPDPLVSPSPTSDPAPSIILMLST